MLSIYLINVNGFPDGFEKSFAQFCFVFKNCFVISTENFRSIVYYEDVFNKKK